MNKIINETKLSMKLKEIELNIKLLNLVCQEPSLSEILLDDINYDLDILLNKIENYKNRCKRG